MKITRFIAPLTLMLALSGAAFAQPTYTITFDTDASGAPIAEGTTIDEQYAAWGAHFVPNVLGGYNATGSPFATNTDMTVTSSDFSTDFTSYADPADFPTGNLLHSYAGHTSENGDWNFWIQFDRPVYDISLDVYGFGIYDPSFALYGLDADYNLVNTGLWNYSPTGGSANAFLSDNAPISFLAVTGSYGYGFYYEWTGVDNIRFADVPEPGGATVATVFAFTIGGLLIRRNLSGRHD